MSELGELLKSTRESQKKTLKDVVDETKIREQFLLIIESGNFKELPSYLHAYGFVKKYAEFLNLDYENIIWPMFSTECPKENIITNNEISKEDYTPATTENTFIENNQPIKSGNKGVLFIIFIIVLLVLGYGGYYTYTNNMLSFLNNNSTDNTIIPTSPSPVVVTEPAITFTDDNTSDNNSYFTYEGASIYDADNGTISDNNTEPVYVDPLFAQSIPSPVVITPEKVIVKFSEECWFKYSTDKGKEEDLVANKGTVLELEFDKTFRMEIGNAVAVSLEYNGEKYDNFGRRNSVRILNYEAVDGKLELIRR